jgi:hypothetical protein
VRTPFCPLGKWVWRLTCQTLAIKPVPSQIGKKLQKLERPQVARSWLQNCRFARKCTGTIGKLDRIKEEPSSGYWAQDSDVQVFKHAPEDAPEGSIGIDRISTPNKSPMVPNQGKGLKEICGGNIYIKRLGNESSKVLDRRSF